MMLTTIKLLLLLQSVHYSFSAHALRSPFNDNDIFALVRGVSNDDYDAILNQVENDLVRLRRYKDSTDYENHYLQYLFACFHKKFVAACGNNNGQNNPFLGMLNEQGLLPTKYAEKFAKGIKHYALCSAFLTMPSPQLPLPIPALNLGVQVPVVLRHLFRNEQLEPLEAISNGQLMAILMDYADKYPVREDGGVRNVYFKNSVAAKLRSCRLKEAFFMLVANPFIQLVEDGFYQSADQITDGTDLPQNCLTSSLTNPPLALTPYYLVQAEHLYPVHLSIGSFYMVPAKELAPFNGPLHNPLAVGQPLPPPAGEDQVSMGQASGVKSYLIPVQFLYSAHLPTGPYCLVPGTALKVAYDQLQIAMADADIPEIGQYLEDEVEVEPMRNEPARQVQPDFIDFDELFDIGDYPTQMQEQEMLQSPFHEWPQSPGQMPLQQQHQQLGSPASASASHASTEGHSSEKAAPPRQAYLIRPDDLPSVVLNNERFYLVSEKNLNFYEGEQPQQQQLDSPVHASASQDQSDFIDLEGLSEDPVQMQRHEMPQSSGQVPLQQQQQLNSPMPASSIQDHPDFIDFSGLSNFGVDPDEFLNPNWPQPQYPGEQPMQPQQQQLSSLSTAPVGPSSEVQFQAYQKQPLPPANEDAVQQSPPVTTPHPESSSPIQFSDTDFDKILQGMALPNQAVNDSEGSNGTSQQGHGEL